MPKRLYPFEESFTSRQKTFVSEKLVNEGALKQQNMEKVYDATLKKLYSGMKLCSQSETKLDHLVTELSTISGNISIPLRQLEINHQGKLSKPRNNSKVLLENIPLQSFSCKGCHVNIHRDSQHSTCTYCDGYLCDSCVRICMRCLKGFCSSCSCTEYNEAVEINICLSCI